MSLLPAKDPNYTTPTYIDYIAKELGNAQIVELRYRLFPGVPPLSRKDAEPFLTNLIEQSALCRNKRFFATLDVYYAMSLSNVTELEKVVGRTGRVDVLTTEYIQLDCGDRWTLLPPYSLREAPIGEEVRITMEMSEEKTLAGHVEAALNEAHMDLKPFAFLYSQTPGEVPYSPLPFHRLCVFLDQDMKHNIDKYPNTIGKERLPIQSLALMFPHVENWKLQVEELGNLHFSSWRKSRGDGNCYYRSLSVAYLEGLMRIGRVDMLFGLLKRLETQQDYFLWEGLEDHHYYFHLRLKPFLEQFQGSATIVQDFQQLLEDVAFDVAMIGVFKNLAADWLFRNQNNDEIMPFILDTGVNPVIQTMLEDEKEGEGITFLAMASALQAQVTHIIANEKVPKTHSEDFRPLEGQVVLGVNLLLRPGHYDILYQEQEDQQDKYDCFARHFY